MTILLLIAVLPVLFAAVVLMILGALVCGRVVAMALTLRGNAKAIAVARAQARFERASQKVDPFDMPPPCAPPVDPPLTEADVDSIEKAILAHTEKKT